MNSQAPNISSKTGDNQIKKLIQILAGTEDATGTNIADCEVISVDKSKRICKVIIADTNKTGDGIEVRLMPSIGDGEFNIPTVGETISVIFSEFFKPLMFDYTWLDAKIIIVGDQGWEILPDKQIINDGKYGGLARVINPDDEDKSLLARLNDQEEKYNYLVDQFNMFKQNFDDFIQTKYNTHTHVYNPGPLTPAPTAPTTSTGTPSSADDGEQIDITTQSDIENPNVTHGDKLADAPQ